MVSSVLLLGGASVLSDDELAATIESLVAGHGTDERRCKQPRSLRQVWRSTCDVELRNENRRLRASCTSRTENESLTMTQTARLEDLAAVRVMEHPRREGDRSDSPTHVVLAACSSTACATVEANWVGNGPEPGSYRNGALGTAETSIVFRPSREVQSGRTRERVLGHSELEPDSGVAGAGFPVETGARGVLPLSLPVIGRATESNESEFLRGGLLRTDDGGATWDEVPIPLDASRFRFGPLGRNSHAPDSGPR